MLLSGSMHMDLEEPLEEPPLVFGLEPHDGEGDTHAWSALDFPPGEAGREPQLDQRQPPQQQQLELGQEAAAGCPEEEGVAGPSAVESDSQQQQQLGEAGAGPQAASSEPAAALASSQHVLALAAGLQEPAGLARLGNDPAAPQEDAPAPAQAQAQAPREARAAASAQAHAEAPAALEPPPAPPLSPEASEASVPDIDEVPEQALEPRQVQQQQQEQLGPLQELAPAAQQPGVASEPPSAAPEAEQPSEQLREQPSEQPSEQPVLQALAAPSDEFASPASSWHSCMTSASRASALSSGAGPGASVLAAAATATGSCTSEPAGTAQGPATSACEAKQPPSPPQEQQQQQQQQQHASEEEAWQELSPPPSLSSSPPTPLAGLLEQRAPPAAPAEPEALAASLADMAPGMAGAGEPAADAAAADAAGELGEPGEASDELGHGRFFSQPPGMQLHAGGQPYPGHASVAASSCMLRQSELVDLSLSSSLHPGLQQQQAQRQHGWLHAHQQLPPAAARAVDRAAMALNESYFFHGAESGPGAGGASAGVAAASGAAAAPAAPPLAQYGAGAQPGGGAVGLGIRRASAAQWPRSGSTQPQTDARARHRLPSGGGGGSGASGAHAWPGAAALGDWLSAGAAAAGRAAAGVGQRLGVGLAGAGAQAPGQRGAPAQRQASCPGGPGGAGGPGGGPGPGGEREGEGEGGGGGDDGVLVEAGPDLPQSLQEQEDEAFRGLLFLGGRDAHGRPVVVVNADALPAGANAAPRDAALAYLRRRLGPLVARGPYVLVFVSFAPSPSFRLLPGRWCVRAYQSLPRPFKKNVKLLVLLAPSLLTRAVLALLWPFVSAKAHAKVKQVPRLVDIDEATSGGLLIPHLGEAFLTTLQEAQAAQAAAAAEAAQAAAAQARLCQQQARGSGPGGRPGVLWR